MPVDESVKIQEQIVPCSRCGAGVAVLAAGQPGAEPPICPACAAADTPVRQASSPPDKLTDIDPVFDAVFVGPADPITSDARPSGPADRFTAFDAAPLVPADPIMPSEAAEPELPDRLNTFDISPGDSIDSAPASDTTAQESPSPIDNAATYQCAVCRQRFSADGVYESSDGLITCTACWNRANAPPPRADVTAAPAPVEPPPRPRPPVRPPLLARVTCPHCWNRFAPADILWVSRHVELAGDPVAGPDAPLRFLPSRFNLEGAALDGRGMACQSLACPACHLIIPRPLIEAEPLFTSIVGVSSSGKSYFLTAMSWELRRLLPKYFGISFGDADASSNRVLNHREETLFLPASPDRPVKLDKTDTVGSLMYDQIRQGQQIISLPRPFLFTMRPSSRHPNAEVAAHLARVVVMYDNAGEHFGPGEDTASSPVTQHLGASRVMMFLYDPTQDSRFRARCKGLSDDPQLDEPNPTRRQETILLESAGRVRQLAGLPATHQIERPMLVVVPKADVWGKLIDLDLSTEPLVPNAVANGTLAAVDLDRVDGVSAMIREMLQEIAPEFVATADEFSANVVYIPVSALGASPQIVPGRPGLWIKPGLIRPRWVTVPFLYMFARWSHDLIGGARFENAKE